MTSAGRYQRTVYKGGTSGARGRHSLPVRDVVSTALATAMGAPGGLNVEVVRWDKLADLVLEALEAHGYEVVSNGRSFE